MRRETESTFMKAKLKKSKVKTFSVSLMVLICSFTAKSQSTPVFGWQSHYSYNQIIHIDANTERIYAATDLVAYFVDQQDQSTYLLNKNTGLSDIGISTIKCSTNGDVLAIGYENGNIDLINDLLITNITAILDAENITEKSINAFVFEDNFLWIGTGFGMVKYDLTESVIVESYRNIGQSGSQIGINDFVITSDSIHAASADGILSVSLDDQTNRQDFNFWRRQLTGISFEQIVRNTGGIVASSNNDLFRYNTGIWQFSTNFSSSIQDIEPAMASFYVLTEEALYEVSDGIPAELLVADAEQKMLSLFSDQTQTLIGTESQGLLVFTDPSATPEQVLPIGPSSDENILSIDSANHLFWLSAKTIAQFSPKEHVWSSQNLQIASSNSLINAPNDLVIGINTVVSSFESGAYVLSSGAFEPLTEFSLSTTLNDENGSFRLSAIQGDRQKRLWFIQQGILPQLHLWNPLEQSWRSFNLAHPQGNHLTDLFIIDNGDKWMSVADNRGGGLLVYNEESNRERYLNINGGQGGLPGSLVNDVVQDQDRFIWVATDEGICFFAIPEQILNNVPLTANIPIYEGSFLLRDEHITQVAIDPANRKWFGTLDNGVWLFSATGEELVHHFTSENSPLPSNQIIDISIDESSGKVYFTTPKGIASFRSDATLGTSEHQNVKAYPNPVSPNFNGQVVIEGLVNNAQLKITDTSGKLVRSFAANGGTATWNVRDQSGARVSSGVYLIFSSNSDGSETYIGKIVVI